MRVLLPIVLFLTPLAVFGQTPTFDISGNSLLKGTYNFRQIYFEVGDDSGNFQRNIAVWGGITFDGNGNYTLSNASVLDSKNTGVQAFSLTGTYAISASGFGFLDSPALKGAKLYGLVSQGIFVSSSTDDVVNDLFVAAPAAATAPTLASFSGKYWVAEMNFPSLNASLARDAFFQINPDGQGHLGSVSVTGYTGDSGNPVTQTIAAPTYAFAANQGTISYGGAATAHINGDRLLFRSADGQFIFGGSSTGWDMFVGVKALSGPAPKDLLNGLYYQAGIDQDNSTLTSDGYVTIDSYFGAYNAKASTGDFLAHQRLLTGFDTNPFDYAYSDTFALASDGSHDDFFEFHHILGAAGAIEIGYGTDAYLGIAVALKSPSFSGPGVYINPTAVVNAASYTPFTIGVSPGELIRIYGTGLASKTLSDGTFPKTLSGVQVLINGRQSPVYLVSPGEVDAVVPWATAEDIVAVQILNNGVASNVVTVFRAVATPGIFSLSQDGVGYAAALHADYSGVTAQSPARPGETVSVYMTGLGAVTPAVADGVPAPSNPLSKTSNSTESTLNGNSATVLFAGLAPQFIGLYQMNITVPAGTPAGNAFLDIDSVGSVTDQVQLPIGARATGATSAVSTTRARPHRRTSREAGLSSDSSQGFVRRGTPSERGRNSAAKDR